MAKWGETLESMVTTSSPATRDVVQHDLDYICEKASASFEALAGHRVLLTGGAGFLGYYIVQSMMHWNHRNPSRPIDLLIADNLIRGVPAWLEATLEEDHITLLKHDVTQPLPQEANSIDYIIHAASIASPIYYRKHPIETMDANVLGLRLLLDRAVEMQQEGSPMKGFLFFSSSEIYGDPPADHIPTPESYWGHVSCTGPRACYDESKRFGETLCVNFAAQYNLPIAIARPFNNYGPGLHINDRRAIPDFARDILGDEDIVLLSDGSPTRTFCYVADAVCGYLHILTSGRPGESYNIGTESPEISIRDLAELMADLGRDLFGYGGNVIMKASNDPEYLTDNPNRRCPDVSKARKALGYMPEISLEEGLRRSLLWYRSHPHANAQ